MIQSWDEFERVFGGFGAELEDCYLAPGVYGFFLNGGTACYVVRVATGQYGKVELTSRQEGAKPAPVLVARTPTEAHGDTISVTVVDSSYLTDRLKELGGDQFKGQDHLKVAYANEPIAHVENGRNLQVPTGSDFVRGDRVLLEKTVDQKNYSFSSTVQALEEVKDDDQKVVALKITLKEAITTVDGKKEKVDFTGGTVRTADLEPDQRELRLTMPEKVQTHQLLPRGSAVEFKVGAATEIHTVDYASGNKIRLMRGLSKGYVLSNTSRPEVHSLEFDLTISDSQCMREERFTLLSMHHDHPNYWPTVVQSTVVVIEEPSALPRPLPSDPRPKAGTYQLTDGQADNRQEAWRQFAQNPAETLDLLRPIDDVAIVCIPGATDAAVQQALRDHCETMGDRFAILDAGRDAEPGAGGALQTQFANVRSASGYAALYYPWILARNPATGNDEPWPPSGHIAGIYARSDAQHGVHKAPANTNVRGALGLTTRLTDEQQSPLNALGINVLRVFPGQAQPLVWGARTTATDRNWQYINIRRLFMFVEESIEEGIRWAIFEPNNLQLWQKVKRTITEFLTRVWRDGALFGATPEQAFYVRVDGVLNPPSEQKLGRLNIEVGMRPTYTAEFIVVRIGIWDGGAEVKE